MIRLLAAFTIVALTFAASATAATSPDGTVSTPPSGPALTAGDGGVWAWSSAAAGRPGEYIVKLNAGATYGIGSSMEVAGGGKLYVNTVNNGWYVWTSNGFVPSAAPPAVAPPPVVPPPVSPPAAAAYLTKDLTWTPGVGISGAAIGGFPQVATVLSVTCRVEAAVGSPAVFTVVLAPSGTPVKNGAPVAKATCDGNASLATNQPIFAGKLAVPAGAVVGILADGPTLPAGNLAAWTGGSGMGIVTVEYSVP